MEEKDFIENFYNEYGFYPPESVNSWEDWNESQNIRNTELLNQEEKINQLFINN